MVLAVGALLRLRGGFPFDFLLFAIAVSVAPPPASCCRLAGAARTSPLARLRVVPVRPGRRPRHGHHRGERRLPVGLHLPLRAHSCWRAASCCRRRGGLVVAASLASLLYVLLVLGRTHPAPAGAGRARPRTPRSRCSPCSSTRRCCSPSPWSPGRSPSATTAPRRSLEDQRKHLSDLQAFRDLIFQSVGSGLDRSRSRAAGSPPSTARRSPSRACARTGGARPEVGDDLRRRGRSRRGARGRGSARQRSPPALRDPPAAGATGRRCRSASRSGRCAPATGEVVGLIGVCQDLSSHQADGAAHAPGGPARRDRPPLRQHRARDPQPARLDLGRDRGAGPRAAARPHPEPARRDRAAGVRPAQPASSATSSSTRGRPRWRPIEINLAEILDEVLLLIEHRSLPANLKVVSRIRRDAAGAGRPPAAAPGDLESLPQRRAGHARRGRAARGSAGSLPRARAGRLQIWISDTGHGHRRDRPAAYLRAVLLDQGGGQRHRPRPRLPGRPGARRLRSRCAASPGEGTTFVLTLPAPRGCPQMSRTAC